MRSVGMRHSSYVRHSRDVCQQTIRCRSWRFQGAKLRRDDGATHVLDDQLNATIPLEWDDGHSDLPASDGVWARGSFGEQLSLTTLE
jgi:hypothetical protein